MRIVDAHEPRRHASRTRSATTRGTKPTGGIPATRATTSSTTAASRRCALRSRVSRLRAHWLLDQPRVFATSFATRSPSACRAASTRPDSTGPKGMRPTATASGISRRATSPTTTRSTASSPGRTMSQPHVIANYPALSQRRERASIMARTRTAITTRTRALWQRRGRAASESRVARAERRDRSHRLNSASTT